VRDPLDPEIGSLEQGAEAGRVVDAPIGGISPSASRAVRPHEERTARSEYALQFAEARFELVLVNVLQDVVERDQVESAGCERDICHRAVRDVCVWQSRACEPNRLGADVEPCKPGERPDLISPGKEPARAAAGVEKSLAAPLETLSEEHLGEPSHADVPPVVVLHVTNGTEVVVWQRCESRDLGHRVIIPAVDVDDFKLRDAASYDDRAEDYGRYIAVLSEPLAAEICRLAGIGPGCHVLDIGCGTGVSSRHAAHLVAPGGSVTAVDLSAGMLADAERRSSVELAAGALRFVRMDAEDLQFGSGSFDTVISLCAVLHFPRVDRALSEMRRVIRPGGFAVVGIGAGRPSDPLGLLRHAGRLAFRRVLHPRRPDLRAPHTAMRLADAMLPPATEPLLTEWAGTKPIPRLVEAMRGAGFHDVETSWLGHEVDLVTPDSYWQAQVAIVTELRKRLALADADTRDLLRERFLRDVGRAARHGGRLLYPYGAVFARGRAT
jgi:SAM-dependent methyltransferase